MLAQIVVLLETPVHRTIISRRNSKDSHGRKAPLQGKEEAKQKCRVGLRRVSRWCKRHKGFAP